MILYFSYTYYMAKKKKFKFLLNQAKNRDVKKFPNIQPFQIYIKGNHLSLQTPLASLHAKFREKWLKNMGEEAV